MAEPPPSTPNPIPPSGSAPPPAPSTSTPPQQPPAAPTLKPREPLTGFRASLEHTGVPRSVLTWKPRLPSRNWTIFLTVVGTITYLYYDDRRQCKAIREQYLDRVRYRGLEPTGSSLELPRKVKVIGAKWPEDDDDDRALRYFRKYVKPYLVTAAIDYDQMSAPLHGSITRQLHAQILKKRREALGLQAPLDNSLPLPVTVDPKEAEQRELEGGTVIVGRASLKEYLEGMNRGWFGRVDDWDWEKSIGDDLDKDGMFDRKSDHSLVSLDSDPSLLEPTSGPTAPSTPYSPPASSLPGSLSFLSRPPPPSLSRPPQAGDLDTPPSIPESAHIPPYPLPPQAPILFVPFISRLGFRQIPWMMYDFFTERYRVKSGAEAALALIEGHTREFRGLTSGSPTSSDLLVDSASPSPSPSPSTTSSDTEFGKRTESWYKKAFRELPDRMATARRDYNTKLEERMRDVYDLEDGRRQLTDDEKKSTKPLPTIQDLKAERRKKELRWKGSEEGYEIVRPESAVAWDERMDGWLRVFELDPASAGAPIESDIGAGESSS